MVLLVLITLSQEAQREGILLGKQRSHGLGGSYLASQGYFKPIEEKLVPYVYLALLVLLIGQARGYFKRHFLLVKCLRRVDGPANEAILREIWTRAFQNFGPMVEVGMH